MFRRPLLQAVAGLRTTIPHATDAIVPAAVMIAMMRPTSNGKTALPRWASNYISGGHRYLSSTPIGRNTSVLDSPSASSATTTSDSEAFTKTLDVHEMWFDNIYPVKLNKFDPRHYWVKRSAAQFAKTAKQSIIPAPETFGTSKFNYVSSVSSIKEGGLLMRFTYEGGPVEEAYQAIRAHVETRGLRSSFNFGKINVYPVKGFPFIEDLQSSIPSSRVKVEFDGPELSIESLYKEFRDYGKIDDITIQKGANKDAPKYAHIQFVKIRSATSARVCMQGRKIGNTRVSVYYEPAIKQGTVFAFIRDHPRLSLPIILAILAALSFIIFDPMRIFFVTNHITDRFNVVKYGNIVSQWFLQAKNYVTSMIYGEDIVRKKRDSDSVEEFSERRDQEKRLLTYLKETPDTVMLVSGPKGTGKSDLVRKASATEPFKLVIDCEELISQPDHILLNRFAHQVGFFPMFSWTVSAGALIDSVITGLTGTKAGFSSTTDGQVRKILEILTITMNRITSKQLDSRQKAIAANKQAMLNASSSENASADVPSIPDVEYPVVIIEGFLSKEKGRQHFMYELLTEWAALLAEYHIAQVVFVSDNPGAIKQISKALPTKTVETVVLTDASSESAMAYVRRRLGLVVTTPELLQKCVDAIGGRLTDLELLVQKIQATAKDSKADLSAAVSRAFSDIVVRSVTEIRKIGLFEDSVGNGSGTVAEKKEWSAVQMWKVIQLLSKFEEVSYDDLRYHALFKGDERAIQAMERAGLISVTLMNGRPYAIRPGRPIYRSAFAHLLSDSKYAAIMGIQVTKALIAEEESKLRKIEEELAVLTGRNGIGSSESRVYLTRAARRELEARVEFLGKLIGEGQKKVGELDNEERRLKKIVKLVE
ncbi:mitochondrial escape protein 2 [Blyttiomyces sp. JEL0837]|nr:mitochondrial escape protein 2 [Blyttiomyces sp. JEL0837]